VSPIRRLLIWLGPAPLLAGPYLVVLINERTQQAHALDTVIMAPAALSMWGFAWFGLLSPVVGLIAGGVFWYLLGVSLLNSLLGRPSRLSRVVFILLCTGAFLMAMVGWSLRGWNPD
jgi:hypothetical protein